MKGLIGACLAALLLVLQPSLGHAGEAEPPASRITDVPIESLFDRLAASDSEAAAAPFEAEIIRRFHRSGSPTADLLLRWASKAIDGRDHGPALDLLDRLTLLHPDFAEAWNKRATVHFRRNEYGKALADIERVLRLEPRHFRALAGLGFILREIGEEEAAMEALRQALALHPHLEDAQRVLDRLETRAARREI
jgi:Flp pilus assembly protein TadD